MGRPHRRHRRLGRRAADVDAAAVGVDAVDPGADRRPADADALAGDPGAAPLPLAEPTGETGFVTFGVPAPAPPSDVLIPPRRRRGRRRQRPGSEGFAAPPADVAPPVAEPEPAAGVRDLRRAAALAAADERAAR